MAFFIGCCHVLISSAARSRTSYNSVVIFLVRSDGYCRLSARHNIVISHGQLHYGTGRHSDGNRKFAVNVPLWNRKLKWNHTAKKYVQATRKGYLEHLQETNREQQVNISCYLIKTDSKINRMHSIYFIWQFSHVLNDQQINL